MLLSEQRRRAVLSRPAEESSALWLFRSVVERSACTALLPSPLGLRNQFIVLHASYDSSASGKIERRML